MYYVIGDVHGYYDKLTELVSLLPADASLIFVGDIIDRGPDSAKVIDFVRSNGHLCVRGNHEEYMIYEGEVKGAQWHYSRSFEEWMINGGDTTLDSYGIRDGYAELVRSGSKRLDRFYDDIEWLKTLPYYIELEDCRVHGRSVVISHSAVCDVWEERHKNPAAFNRHVTLNRSLPTDTSGIYNIFGHTPHVDARISEFAASIDTGAYIWGKLTALSIPELAIRATTLE